jgi:hypothetical protein
MTRLVGQVLVQAVTVAAEPTTVYSNPSADSACAPLGVAKLAAIKKESAAVTILLVGIRDPMLPPRDPKRQAHTCTIPWREEF